MSNTAATARPVRFCLDVSGTALLTHLGTRDHRYQAACLKLDVWELAQQVMAGLFDRVGDHMYDIQIYEGTALVWSAFRCSSTGAWYGRKAGAPLAEVRPGRVFNDAGALTCLYGL